MPPSPNFDQNFRASVNAILKNWTALQLAVSQGAGGHQSKEIAEWMVDAIIQWFNENQNLEPYEVTEFLEEIVNQEFNLIVDDGSVDEVGTAICEFYQLCTSSKSNDEIVAKIHSLPKCDLSRCKVDAQNNEEEAMCQKQNELEKQMNSMEVESELDSHSTSAVQNMSDTSKQELDPDGWILVDRKKK